MKRHIPTDTLNLFSSISNSYPLQNLKFIYLSGSSLSEKIFGKDFDKTFSVGYSNSAYRSDVLGLSRFSQLESLSLEIVDSSDNEIFTMTSYQNIFGLKSRKLLISPFKRMRFTYKNSEESVNSANISKIPFSKNSEIPIFLRELSNPYREIHSFEPDYITQDIHSLQELIENDFSISAQSVQGHGWPLSLNKMVLTKK
ncbi:MAG: hypothetical protein VXZ40_03860 [Nanoarchaeota archaeon]|nr:hypothetical protein [Nanoarchaeota archaeon]